MDLANAIDKLLRARSGDNGSELPYIKDWHLVLQSKDLENVEDRIPYYAPDIFKDDWLNNVRPDQDDFRFCYAGVKGSFTPLHRDVYTSYSWSTNVSGVKLWRLLPPDVAPLLRRDPEKRRSEMIYDLREVDETVFPGWKEARSREICVEQKAGETIFIPSGWYHQVINLTDCISLNQNWCNSCNLLSLYTAMKEAVADVSDAISDVRDLLEAQSKKSRRSPSRLGSDSDASSGLEEAETDWRVEWFHEVDTLLKMDAGWGWAQFFETISYNIDPNTVAAPKHLRPPDDFTHDRVRLIVDDFKMRDEYLIIPEIRTMVDGVEAQLNRHSHAGYLRS